VSTDHNINTTFCSGSTGEFKFDRIGSPYIASVPLMALRLVPALAGSALPPVLYLFMLQLGMSQWTAVIGASLILFGMLYCYYFFI
jgi:dolichyl-phosphate-mannose-protein mannosyltransferase